MDEFGQDFEFKPITEGLGFQRKAKSIKEDIEKSAIAREELTLQIPQSNKNILEKERERALHELMSSLPKQTDFISEEVKVPNKEVHLFAHLRPINTSFPAMIFDAIVSFALSLLFLIALILVTKIDLAQLVHATNTYVANQIGLFVLYVSVTQLYMVTTRAFAGQTLGEWAFDVQLGTPEDQQQTVFPLMVLARSIVITVTGIILLPLISIITGKDYAGKFSGLKLYRAE